MKKLFLVTFTITLFVNNLFSQDNKKVSFGVKAGINIATISNLNPSSSGFAVSGYSSSQLARILPFLGVYSELKITDLVSFQPELLYSVKGVTLKQSASSGNISSSSTNRNALSYLDIPLQVRFNIGKGFHILAGPSVGFLLSASDKSKLDFVTNGNSQSETTTDHSKSGINTVDVGMYLGVGYQLDNGLNFGLRYNRGFTNVFQNSNTNHVNSVFQLGVGYAF